MALTPIDPFKEEDEDSYRARPLWFKFFYGAWLLSTSSMDDEQQGWYIKLLTWAASEGDFPGFLPDDEDELREIAGMKTLSPDLMVLVKNGLVLTPDQTRLIDENRDRRWQKVRRKFIPASEHSGYIYNRKLVDALKDAYRHSKFASQAGAIGAEKRWGKAKRRKEKIAPAIAEPMGLPLPSQFEEPETPPQEVIKPWERVDSSGGNSLHFQDVNSESHENANTPAMQSISLSLISSNENGNTLDRVLSGEIVESNSLSVEKRGAKSRSKRLPESLFDEALFIITDKMKSHLLAKYPEFVEGDITHLATKFCLVYHGKSYTSWSRTFYNFVGNQLVQYNYKPGSFDWRKNEVLKPTVQGTDRYQKFESAAERNARLEQEADDYTRRLQSGGEHHHQEGPKGLPLTTDDD